MSAYPTFWTLQGSTFSPDSGHIPERATNGALKVRRLYTAERGEFRLRHLLTTADRATLEAHYSSNKDAAFDLVFDGTTYSVQYVQAPEFERRGAQFSLAGVRLMVA